MGAVNSKTISFTASTASDEFEVGSEMIMGFDTPDSFGATTIKLQKAQKKGGTYTDVYIVGADMIPVLFQITVDASTGRSYSLTSVFPADVRFARFVAGSSITKDIIVYSKG